MKKLLAIILSAVLLLSAGTIGAFAVRNGAGKGYVDTDNDGVCDNIDAAKCVGYIDEDSDGVCDNREETQKPGQNDNKGFVDNDEDGICDNRGESKRQGKGCGNKQGNRAGYADADRAGNGRGNCRRGR